MVGAIQSYVTLADNPLEDESESPLGEIVPAEWRVVRLEHTEPNGTRHIIERGMPLDKLLLGISFFIPSAPFPPKARGRRGFDYAKLEALLLELARLYDAVKDS